MNLVFAASETAPWSKTGGLGDVAAALPRALARRGHRVLAISPRYKPAPDQRDLGIDHHIRLAGHDHLVRYSHLEKDGVQWVFVDHPSFRRGGIYGDDKGAYADNLLRYALLTRAVLDAPLLLPLFEGRPMGEDVVFHVNDWHTALLPAYLDFLYRPAGRYRRAATVLGVHNAGHQGTTVAEDFGALGLPGRAWPTLDMGGRLNPLKAGLVSADAIVAVSPTYARELQTGGGFGLDPIFQFRRDDLIGILNGIDDSWNPKTDPHLPAHFDHEDLRGKAHCKAALQRELGLPVRPDVPILAMIARLDHQKGVDLVQDIAPWLLRMDVQLVMLGSGSSKYEAFFREVERVAPTKARGWVGFNEALSHRIEAGADIFLMPSRFEPCGLNQMYSMRYGTVPVVHRVGGLADTVQTFDPGNNTGNGWAFQELSAEALQEAVSYALITWFKFPGTWREIIRRGMTRDFSWNRSASTYEKVYENVKARRPPR